MKIDKYTDFTHTGPDTLMGNYLRSFWHPVCISRKLEPGRAIPIKLMGEKFTLYRGEGGTPHLVASLCPHRLTQLSTGWVEGDSIRCMYHGWAFDETGQCIDQPVEEKPFCDKVKIATYPTEEYLGLIFVYIGEGEAPAFVRDPGLEECGLVWNDEWTWPCNYFQQIENYPDHSHTEFVHRRSAFSQSGLTGFKMPIIHQEETEYGILTTGIRDGIGVRKNHMIMPLCHIIKTPPEAPGTPWVHLRAWVVPIDDENAVRFSSFCHPVSKEVGDEIEARLLEREKNWGDTAKIALDVLEGRRRIEDVKEDETDYIVWQDALAMIGQGTVVDRSQERLGGTDQGVSLLRRIYSRELRALDQGKPRRQWADPIGLRATTGVQKADELV